MPFETPEEAYQAFLETGQYMNHEGHFSGTPEEQKAKFGAYKHMIPQQVKRDFKQGVDANENRAIEGMMGGQTREGMDILNQKEHGQALYRRLGAGLKTGLDINKAYDWGAGTAREVGTTDMAKWNTLRGVTGTERQRWNDFQAAGSPEAYWRNYRQSQINGLLASGAIASDGQGGYYNPGPGGGQRYGANLEGYNLGSGNPTGAGGRQTFNMGGPARIPMPKVNTSGMPRMPQMPSAPGSGQVHTRSPLSMPNMPGPRNTGVTGGMWDRKENGGGAIYADQGYQTMNQPPGPLPDGGTPLVVHPGEQVSVTPPPGGAPFPQARANAAQQRNVNEIGPGQAGIPSNMPNGRSPFPSNPMPMPTGTGIVWGPNGPTASGGGNLSPNLPGINLPGNIPMTGWNAGTPWGSGLTAAGQLDNAGQGFSLGRAEREYAGSFGPEATLMNYYGQALGVDPYTGQPLQGAALDASNRASFGMLAPQAQRLSGDTQAAIEQIKAQLPPGGARDQAIQEIMRAGQSDMLGLRQQQAAEARQGLGSIMAMKKGFDPMGYQGGNQALLGAELGARGQDLSTLLGQRGQDIDALLGQRGQDVQWGLGWGGLANSASQNLWDSYFTGRGQDLNLWSNTRGQDLSMQQARMQADAQRQASNRSFWGGLLGTVGGIAGTMLMPGVGTVVGQQLGSRVGGGGFSLGA